ncbi:hypothetical protein FRC12_007775 [Ceratobasidium sp. 428]|nr:hypothetical protein FRC12_007775 [Ceratobasidium sp. 428]
MIFTAGIVLAAAVAGTSAQGLTSVSPTCQNAFTNVMNGPAGACLGVSSLMSVATTPADQSIIPPVNDWLTKTCAQPACTTEQLDGAYNNITAGCKNDFGMTDGSIVDYKEYVDGWYGPGREIACLKDAGDALCVTTTLKGIEKYINQTLSINAISTVIPQLAMTGGNVPKDLTCTPCIQAAYAIIRPKLNENNRGTWDAYLGGQCGSSFTTGSSPSNIKQSANSAPAGSGSGGNGSGNGALSLSSGVFGTLATALLGVAGVAVIGF